MRRIVATVLASAAAVVLVDLSLQTTVARFLWPVVVSPPDGAIATPPVTVRWEGPQRLLAVLSRAGREEPLGLRASPFEIDASSLSRAGEYRLRLESPRFGSWISTERRFFVGAVAELEPEPPPPSPPANEERIATLEQETRRLQQERDRVAAERDFLQEQIGKLQGENRDLTIDLEDLREEQVATDGRLGIVEAQQAELMEQHLAALRENQLLRTRLENLPACTTWGYLSVPRTAAPTRRVIVSNVRGEVFRTEQACLRSRQGDPTAASTCACVGVVSY